MEPNQRRLEKSLLENHEEGAIAHGAAGGAVDEEKQQQGDDGDQKTKYEKWRSQQQRKLYLILFCVAALFIFIAYFSIVIFGDTWERFIHEDLRFITSPGNVDNSKAEAESLDEISCNVQNRGKVLVLSYSVLLHSHHDLQRLLRSHNRTIILLTNSDPCEIKWLLDDVYSAWNEITEPLVRSKIIGIGVMQGPYSEWVKKFYHVNELPVMRVYDRAGSILGQLDGQELMDTQNLSTPIENMRKMLAASNTTVSLEATTSRGL